jgi:hypothetical protein
MRLEQQKAMGATLSGGPRQKIQWGHFLYKFGFFWFFLLEIWMNYTKIQIFAQLYLGPPMATLSHQRKRYRVKKVIYKSRCVTEFIASYIFFICSILVLSKSHYIVCVLSIYFHKFWFFWCHWLHPLKKFPRVALGERFFDKGNLLISWRYQFHLAFATT